MQLSGQIKMMKTSLIEGQANYDLSIGSDTVNMNALVGKKLRLIFKARFHALIVEIKQVKASRRDIVSPVLDLLLDVTCAL